MRLPRLRYSRNSGCGELCGRHYFRWDNGPQGYGDTTPPGTSTQWPSTLNVAATWDPGLAKAWGVAMGEEFWAKGTNIQEGPGACISRVNRNGRTFEYISGEDPTLGATLVVPVVDGIQQNVMAITKHYLVNNQEDHRTTVNELVDEVTLMELYGKPFAAAAARTAGYMCAYNLINGKYACENPHTLGGMLKGSYNFSGFVVSDWGATHSTSPAISAGLDIEMPRAKFFTEEKIHDAITKGEIDPSRIDDACGRILSGWYNLPAEKRVPCGHGSGPASICIGHNVSTPAHKALARELAAKSTVLLKNAPLANGSQARLLPLQTTMKLALIGKGADTPYTAGGGSGHVPSPPDLVSPLDAFRARGLDVTYNDGSDAGAAAAAAKAADVAIVFGYATSGEGSDRKDLSLEDNIDALVPAVAAANPRTAVVMSVPGPILTPWRDAVPAILTNFLPGELVGDALADVLFGDVAPQAKLPVTFPNTENEQGFTEVQYPGVKAGGFERQANYSEGQIVGYRWYDKRGVAPAFAFGHGLTYGFYKYSSLGIEGRAIKFLMEREYGKAGCDTAQVYLAPPNAQSEPGTPLKRLAYFEKACAANTLVQYTVVDADVSHWDVGVKAWVLTTGTWGVLVGSSSLDIRLQGTLVVS